MGWAVNDVVRVKLRATYLAEEIQNILTYNIVTFGVSADIDTLLDVIETQLIDNLMNIVSDAMNWNLIRLDNETDKITFAERIIDVDGILVEAPMPSYVAGGFVKSVSTKVTRPGSMRLAGIVENKVVQNAWTPNTTNIALVETALETILDNGLTSLNKIVLKPIVARETAAGPPAVHLKNDVTAVTHKALITTQNSRKQSI